MITEEWIYSLKKNSGTYDDWTASKIIVSGTSCIGWRIPYNKEIAGLIRNFA
jgi:hypothetical protein